MVDDEFSDLLDAGYIQVQRQYPPEEASFHMCFGCSPTNPIGLKMRFFGKPGDPEVITRYAIGDNYCGFPNYAHGGIIALLFDEVLAYASYHVLHQFGVTKTMSVQYYRPVTLNDVHFLHARVVETKDRPGKGKEVIIEASLHEGASPDDAKCAEATGSYVMIPEERVRQSFAKKQKYPN